MEVVRSVRLSEIDPVFFETSYYVVPGPSGEKPYAILFAALQKTGHVALARVGMGSVANLPGCVWYRREACRSRPPIHSKAAIFRVR